MIDARTLLYEYAMQFVGLPYRWAGDDPVNGFDCSGLCVELLQSIGILPHGSDYNAAGLHSFFTQYATNEPRFGSLAFFGGAAPTHVGFCLTPTLMLEAGGGGSKTTSAAAAAAQNAFIRIRPVKSRKDFIGFRQPGYPWKD